MAEVATRIDEAGWGCCGRAGACSGRLVVWAGVGVVLLLAVSPIAAGAVDVWRSGPVVAVAAPGAPEELFSIAIALPAPSWPGIEERAAKVFAATALSARRAPGGVDFYAACEEDVLLLVAAGERRAAGGCVQAALSAWREGPAEEALRQLRAVAARSIAAEREDPKTFALQVAAGELYGQPVGQVEVVRVDEAFARAVFRRAAGAAGPAVCMAAGRESELWEKVMRAAGEIAGWGQRRLELQSAAEGPREVEVRGPIGEAVAMVCAPCGPYGSEGYKRALILAEILGGGMGSRLYAALREREGLVYTVFAHVQASVCRPFLAVGALCAPGRVREVLAAVREQVRGLAKDGPTAEELERAKRMLVLKLRAAAMSPRARTVMFAAAGAMAGEEGVRFLSGLIGGAACSGAEVQEMAGQMWKGRVELVALPY